MRVLMPLPDRDFDVTEVAVPWQVLTSAGYEVVFASEQADTTLAADPKLLDRVIFGQLGAGRRVPVRPAVRSLTADAVRHILARPLAPERLP